LRRTPDVGAEVLVVGRIVGGGRGRSEWRLDLWEEGDWGAWWMVGHFRDGWAFCTFGWEGETGRSVEMAGSFETVGMDMMYGMGVGETA
jgi:hypothetical protein